MEGMVKELEDLKMRGVFNDDEVRSIVKRRRDFEWLFSKRTPEGEDYKRALEFELSLEALRAERKIRLGLKRSSIGDHSIVRRVHFIFDRACRRFRQSPEWWLQWADFSLRTNSSKAAGRIFARSLQIHPRSIELWLQAAEFEYDRQGNVSTARALFLRALRLNSESLTLWSAYFRMECLYVQKMRGRKFLLGGVGGDAATSGGEDLSGGYIPDIEEGGKEGEGGLPEGPSSLSSQVAAGLIAYGGRDDTKLALPSTSSPLSPEEASFFQGLVPRIVFDQAITQLSCSVETHSAFLAIADEFTDALAAAEVEKLGSAEVTAGAIGEKVSAAPLPHALAAQARATASLGPSALLPAFPELASHILQSLADTFPGNPQAWKVIAERGLARLVSSADCLAAAGEAQSKKFPSGRPDAPLPIMGTTTTIKLDADIFMVDKQGVGKEDLNFGGGTSSSTSSFSDPSVEARKRDEAFKVWCREQLEAISPKINYSKSSSDPTPPSFFGRGPLGMSPPPRGFSLLSLSATLSTGVFDNLCVAPLMAVSQEEGGSVSNDLEVRIRESILPPFSSPIWVFSGADAEVTSASSLTSAAPCAPVSSGKKRGRGVASNSTEQTPTPRAVGVVVNSLSSPLPNDSPVKKLLLWAEAVAASSSKIYVAAAAASGTKGEGGQMLLDRKMLLLAEAGTIRSLLQLPIPSCPENSLRCLSLLNRLVEITTTTTTTTSTASSSETLASVNKDHGELEALEFSLQLLRMQGLMRLGRMREALGVFLSPESSAAMEGTPISMYKALLASNCVRLYRAATSLPQAASGTPPPNPSLSLVQPLTRGAAWEPLMDFPDASFFSTFPSVDKILRGALSKPSHLLLSPPSRASPTPVHRSFLWGAILQSALEGGTEESGGGRESTALLCLTRGANVLKECFSEGLGPSAESSIRAQYLAYLANSFTYSLQNPSLLPPPPSPPPPVHSSLLPLITTALGPSASAAVHAAALESLLGRLPPPLLQRLLENSVALHGATSVGLWVTYLKLESRAQPPLLPPPDVLTRARRALKHSNQASVALEEAAALLASGLLTTKI